MSTTTKINYAKETKALIKDGINRLGGELTNLNTFREYKEALDDIYNRLPKVTGTGSDLSLKPTLKGGLNIVPLGNCEQDTIAYVDVGTWEDGNIDGTNGQNTSLYGGVRTADYIEVKPNVLYNITRTIATSYMVFRFYNSNKQYLGSQATEGMITTDKTQNRMQQNETSMTMTINNANVAYMRLADDSSNLSTVYTISTQAPTPSYPQDVKAVTGDNQVVVSNSPDIFNMQKYANANNNYFSYSQETGLTAIANDTRAVVDIQSLSGFEVNTTYYINANTDARFVVSQWTSSNGWIRTDNLHKGDNFTVASNTVYLRIKIDQITTFPTILGNIYFSTSNNYQKQSKPVHLNNLELCKIGDYQDVITGSKDNWKIVRNVGKYIFNGNEDLANWSANRIIFRDNNINYKTVSTSTPSLILCNNYITVTRSSSATNNSITAFLETEEKGFIICDSEHNTTTLLASFFETQYQANTPVIFYYVLATPTETPITDTTLISELNELQELLSYDGTTNITITSDSNNAQMLVQVSALKGE